MIAQCFMAYIFIVIYSVLFGLFNFGLGIGLLNLASASTSASSVWPRPRPRPRGSGLGLDLGLKHLASFNISATPSQLKERILTHIHCVPKYVKKYVFDGNLN